MKLVKESEKELRELFCDRLDQVESDYKASTLEVCRLKKECEVRKDIQNKLKNKTMKFKRMEQKLRDMKGAKAKCKVLEKKVCDVEKKCKDLEIMCNKYRSSIVNKDKEIQNKVISYM